MHAQDSDGDPVQWEFQGSESLQGPWTLLAEQTTSYNVPMTRGLQLPWFNVAQVPWNTAANCTNPVELYGGSDFSGWSTQFSLGDYPTAAFTAAGAIDNQASSLTVPTGCKVVLYGGSQYTGWSAMFTAGRYAHSAFVAGGAVDDDTSSMKVLSDEAGHLMLLRSCA